MVYETLKVAVKNYGDFMFFILLYSAVLNS
jgi:hypothetical protein